MFRGRVRVLHVIRFLCLDRLRYLIKRDDASTIPIFLIPSMPEITFPNFKNIPSIASKCSSSFATPSCYKYLKGAADESGGRGKERAKGKVDGDISVSECGKA